MAAASAAGVGFGKEEALGFGGKKYIFDAVLRASAGLMYGPQTSHCRGSTCHFRMRSPVFFILSFSFIGLPSSLFVTKTFQSRMHTVLIFAFKITNFDTHLVQIEKINIPKFLAQILAKKYRHILVLTSF